MSHDLFVKVRTEDEAASTAESEIRCWERGRLYTRGTRCQSARIIPLLASRSQMKVWSCFDVCCLTNDVPSEGWNSVAFVTFTAAANEGENPFLCHHTDSFVFPHHFARQRSQDREQDSFLSL